QGMPVRSVETAGRGRDRKPVELNQIDSVLGKLSVIADDLSLPGGGRGIHVYPYSAGLDFLHDEVSLCIQDCGGLQITRFPKVRCGDEEVRAWKHPPAISILFAGLNAGIECVPTFLRREVVAVVPGTILLPTKN